MEINRRGFLQSVTSAVFTLGALSVLPSPAVAQAKEGSLPPPIKLDNLRDPKTEAPDDEMPNAAAVRDKMGVAVVGLGHLALERILPALMESKRCKAVALVSGHFEKAQQVANQYNISTKNIYNYENFNDIQKNSAIDFIYIALPAKLHAEFTIRAAKAGKHILCEKPLAASIADAQAMIAACKNANVKLMTAYRLHYSSCYKMLQQSIQKNEFGKLKFIDINLGLNVANNNQWRLNKYLAGGGALFDVGVYGVNTARFLLQEEPLEVVAQIFSTSHDPRFKEVEEMVNFSLTFPSGVLVSCRCSYGIYTTTIMHVFGSDAVVNLNPAFGHENITPKISRKMSDEIQATHELVFEKENQFVNEIDHMAHCIKNNLTPLTPGEEGLQDHRIMQAIYQSARAQRPIKIMG